MMISAIKCCDGGKNNQTFGAKPTLRPSRVFAEMEDAFARKAETKASGGDWDEGEMPDPLKGNGK